MSIATMIDRAAPHGVGTGDEVVLCDTREHDPSGLKIALAFDGVWFKSYVVGRSGRGKMAEALTKEDAVRAATDAYFDSLPRVGEVSTSRELAVR